MKEEKRKILYLDPEIKILTFETGDVITTSGGSEDQDDDYRGPTFSGSDSWT
ncbi:MAG: hypothetical protein J6B48_10280 [Clostridia bacterium]|nr:hypothetical protein [Clostridia bacterium]